jgi:hypothetical protein
VSLLHIVDVSAYQDTTVPAVDAVLVKATEGSTYSSGKFAAQWRSAGQRAKHRGAYHFARPEASSARSQADRFLLAVQPVPGESVWLDLEASDLSQARTHDWAAAWGDYIREQVPGVTSGIYMGSGYASSNTGRNLRDHYSLWWYPQYPGKYQVSTSQVDVEELRAANRSHMFPYRTPIAAMTTSWPPAVSPWLPAGITTGWPGPHIWQFTDNWRGYDASVSALTLDQLAGGGQATPTQEDMMLSGSISAGKGAKPSIICPGLKTVQFGFDNTLTLTDPAIERQGPATLRVAMHQPGRKGTVESKVTVGAAADDTKGWADNVKVTLPSGCDRIDVVRLDDGAGTVGFCVS